MYTKRKGFGRPRITLDIFLMSCFIMGLLEEITFSFQEDYHI